AINDARAEGCGNQPGVKIELRSSAKLGEAARYLSRGRSLQDAMQAAGYHAIKSSSVHMNGWLTEGSIARIFGKRFCDSLGASQLSEIGFYRKDRDIWFVLAQPFSSLALHDRPGVMLRVLELTNEARSHARRCGSQSFAPAGPLKLSIPLYRAALEHSRDM